MSPGTEANINTNNLLHQSIISCLLILSVLWISFKIFQKHKNTLRPHVTAQILFLGKYWVDIWAKTNEVH